MKLITHLYVVPKVRISGIVSLIPGYPFVASTEQLYDIVYECTLMPVTVIDNRPSVTRGGGEEALKVGDFCEC